MTQTSFGSGLLILLYAVSWPAEARQLHPRGSYPQAETIMVGRNAQYVVRFDGLVDHAASRLEVTAEGKVIASLVPTGDSEPDVVAASAPILAPGHYQLHWHVRSSPDGDFSDGFIPFTVAR